MYYIKWIACSVLKAIAIVTILYILTCCLVTRTAYVGRGRAMPVYAMSKLRHIANALKSYYKEHDSLPFSHDTLTGKPWTLTLLPYFEDEYIPKTGENYKLRKNRHNEDLKTKDYLNILQDVYNIGQGSGMECHIFVADHNLYTKDKRKVIVLAVREKWYWNNNSEDKVFILNDENFASQSFDYPRWFLPPKKIIFAILDDFSVVLLTQKDIVIE